MSLKHAPCGDAGGVDREYPHNEGSIGIWGYYIPAQQLLDPQVFKDIMGYCAPVWISDYHFDRATTHRLNGDGGGDIEGGSVPAGSLGRGKMLVVWGSVQDGQLTLDPAFVVDGPAALPEMDGPYRIEGLGTGLETRFSLSFSPTPLAHGGGGFVFFVPHQPEWAENLDRLVLTGPEGEYTLTRDGERPLAVVTDPFTGRIQALVRNWDGRPLPGEGTADVTITRGISTGELQ